MRKKGTSSIESSRRNVVAGRKSRGSKTGAKKRRIALRKGWQILSGTTRHYWIRPGGFKRECEGGEARTQDEGVSTEHEKGLEQEFPSGTGEAKMRNTNMSTGSGLRFQITWANWGEMENWRRADVGWVSERSKAWVVGHSGKREKGR